MSKKDLPKNVKINNHRLQIYSYSYKSHTATKGALITHKCHKARSESSEK